SAALLTSCRFRDLEGTTTFSYRPALGLLLPEHGGRTPDSGAEGLHEPAALRPVRLPHVPPDGSFGTIDSSLSGRGDPERVRDRRRPFVPHAPALRAAAG